MRDILFIKPENIYERSSAHKNIDSKMLVSEIKTCQEIYLLPVLGTALYERLQDGIVANNLTALETTLLQQYIRDSLIWYTIAETSYSLTYQLWNKGVTKKTTQNTESVSTGDVDDFKEHYKNRAEWYRERLINFLIEEAGSGKFSEYINPGNRVDTFVPKRKSYEIGIYLGDSNKCCDDKPSWYKYEFLSCCK